jgi:hypothetical protein
MAHSSNGWIDSELAYEWFVFFEETTRTKAAGESRVLHLDTHKTHVTSKLIQFAHDHNVHVIGYPPNATDRLQGLDMIHFAQVKRKWPAKVQEHEENGYGSGIDNSHMLEIIDSVWKEVFTVSNNQRAFEVTGLAYPVITGEFTSQATTNQSVIPTRAIAPAENSSIQSSFPLQQPKPVSEAVNILELVDRLRNPPLTPTHTPPPDIQRTAATTSISPSSLHIHPSQFTPRKRDAAIAQHVNPVVQVIPLRSEVSADTPIITPLPDPTYHYPMASSHVAPPFIDPALMSREELEEEVSRRRANDRFAHQKLEEQASMITGQHAQLIIQNEHQIGTQRRLNNKNKRKDNSHVAMYLQKEQARGRTGRVYTEAGYRAAQEADIAQAAKSEQAKLKGSAVRVARSRRAAWRRETKEERKTENQRRRQEYEEACKDHAAADGRPLRAPRVLPKEPTPEYFSQAIEKAQNLQDYALEELRSVVADASGKGEQDELIWHTLQSLPLEKPASSDED